MREENFWCKKPRYSEVRVIARRVIARYDFILVSIIVLQIQRNISRAFKFDKLIFCVQFDSLKIKAQHYKITLIIIWFR